MVYLVISLNLSQPNKKATIETENTLNIIQTIPKWLKPQIINPQSCKL